METNKVPVSGHKTLSQFISTTRVSSEGLAGKIEDKFEPSTPAEEDSIPPFFSRGNKVKPLFDESVTPDNKDDSIFDNIRDAIKDAKYSIQIEMYQFGMKDIAELLVDSVKKGIKVQVLLDPVNELPFEEPKQEIMKYLKENGVEVLEYPIVQLDDKKRPQINHVKMLLVDGKTAIIGGMNWGTGSWKNRDVDVKIEGPAVKKMVEEFQKDWLKSGGDIKEIPDLPEPVATGDDAVSVITSSEVPKEQIIHKAILRNIYNAKKYIHVEMFALSDWQIINGLIEAQKRGVDVKVILNPLKIDNTEINKQAADRLKAGGVQVRWFIPKLNDRNQILHAKMGIFDDKETILGSANWTGSGLHYNREADVDVLSSRVTKSFDEIFKYDWENRTSSEPQYLEDNTTDDAILQQKKDT